MVIAQHIINLPLVVVVQILIELLTELMYTLAPEILEILANFSKIWEVRGDSQDLISISLMI
ncbi:hypothetical protein ES703_14705 [subsurface metagenome]